MLSVPQSTGWKPGAYRTGDKLRGNDGIRGGLWVFAGGHRDPLPGLTGDRLLRLRAGTSHAGPCLFRPPPLIGCACNDTDVVVVVWRRAEHIVSKILKQSKVSPFFI